MPSIFSKDCRKTVNGLNNFFFWDVTDFLTKSHKNEYESERVDATPGRGWGTPS